MKMICFRIEASAVKTIQKREAGVGMGGECLNACQDTLTARGHRNE